MLKHAHSPLPTSQVLRAHGFADFKNLSVVMSPDAPSIHYRCRRFISCIEAEGKLRFSIKTSLYWCRLTVRTWLSSFKLLPKLPPFPLFLWARVSKRGFTKLPRDSFQFCFFPVISLLCFVTTLLSRMHWEFLRALTGSFLSTIFESQCLPFPEIYIGSMAQLPK